jgi:hypothetical protein
LLRKFNKFGLQFINAHFNEQKKMTSQILMFVKENFNEQKSHGSLDLQGLSASASCATMILIECARDQKMTSRRVVKDEKSEVQIP